MVEPAIALAQWSPGIETRQPRVLRHVIVIVWVDVRDNLSNVCSD
jgi:hypothetical protein